MPPPPHHRTWGDLLRPFVKYCPKWLQPWPEAIWGQIWTSRRTPPRSSQEIRSSWLVNKCHNHVFFCFWSHETSSTKLIPSANMEGGFEYGGSFFFIPNMEVVSTARNPSQMTTLMVGISLVKRSVSWWFTSPILVSHPWVYHYLSLCLYICENTHFRHTDVRWLSSHVDFYILPAVPGALESGACVRGPWRCEEPAWIEMDWVLMDVSNKWMIYTDIYWVEMVQYVMKNPWIDDFRKNQGCLVDKY